MIIGIFSTYFQIRLFVEVVNDVKYMQRCIELATMALGNTYPNPLVGSVIVHNGKIIGEGYHTQCGEPHAEVNAIESVKDKSLLKESTLYVNLEPCSHFGKTPPCSLLIRNVGIPKVVIGCRDSYSEVNGRGIENLRANGVEVVYGVLEEESREVNRRFFTFHEKKRPFIILKWAQTQDGFVDVLRPADSPKQPTWISNPRTRQLVHKWRGEEPSILVGTNTALADNPSLTTRDWAGANPMRLVVDRNGVLPDSLALFDGTVPTVVYTMKNREFRQPNANYPNSETVIVESSELLVDTILNDLYKRDIQSLVVEGGSRLIDLFVDKNMWDEARVIIGDKWFGNGVKAPVFNNRPIQTINFATDKILYYRNNLMHF